VDPQHINTDCSWIGCPAHACSTRANLDPAPRAKSWFNINGIGLKLLKAAAIWSRSRRHLVHIRRDHIRPAQTGKPARGARRGAQALEDLGVRMA
jgi:hypothetical protein